MIPASENGLGEFRIRDSRWKVRESGIGYGFAVSGAEAHE